MRCVVGLEIEVSDEYSIDFVEGMVLAGLCHCSKLKVVNSMIEKK